jgi:hypothetical protein
VRTLLSRKADVNERYDRDRTALQVAAAEGHAGVVKELLARGANVNAKDSSGLTALHLASGGAIRPLSACCLPTMRMSMGGAEDGTTPLREIQEACRHGASATPNSEDFIRPPGMLEITGTLAWPSRPRE